MEGEGPPQQRKTMQTCKMYFKLFYLIPAVSLKIVWNNQFMNKYWATFFKGIKVSHYATHSTNRVTPTDKITCSSNFISLMEGEGPPQQRKIMQTCKMYFKLFYLIPAISLKIVWNN